MSMSSFLGSGVGFAVLVFCAGCGGTEKNAFQEDSGSPGAGGIAGGTGGGSATAGNSTGPAGGSGGAPGSADGNGTVGSGVGSGGGATDASFNSNGPAQCSAGTV